MGVAAYCDFLWFTSNMRQTYRERLRIKDRMESHLNANKQLTAERQDAIKPARFKCARQIWLFDKLWAKDIISKIERVILAFIACELDFNLRNFLNIGFMFFVERTSASQIGITPSFVPDSTTVPHNYRLF